MKEYLENFEGPLESEEENQNNNIQSIQEDIQNNNFQTDFQNYYLQSGEYGLNFSIYEEQNFIDLNTKNPNVDEDIVVQQTIISNHNNNHRQRSLYNPINNNIINPNTINTFNTTKKGRKTKNSTEKGTHTTYSPDNRRALYWTLFMNYILMLVNSYSSPDEMDSPNFIQQYGSNCITKNERFLELKIYQYFSYNTFYNDNKRHKNIGTNNLKIIKKMVFEKRNEAYIAIMKTTIKDMFEKFKNNEKYIIKNNKLYYLPDFKTIDDAFIEIQNNLEEENILSTEEIQDELNRFENLVEFVKIEGQKIKRKEKCTRQLNYIIIPELEDD